jgi:hypothetical protein
MAALCAAFLLTNNFDSRQIIMRIIFVNILIAFFLTYGLFAAFTLFNLYPWAIVPIGIFIGFFITFMKNP